VSQFSTAFLTSRFSSGLYICWATRLCRFPLRLSSALLAMKPVFFLSELAYAAGYLTEVVGKRRVAEALLSVDPKDPKPPAGIQPLVA